VDGKGSSTGPAPQRVLMDLKANARPRYRSDQPVLWRRAGTVQVGTCIIEQVSSTDVAWLVGLDGLRTLTEVRADCPGTSSRRLLTAALAAGAIEDARLGSEALRWTPAEQRTRVLGDLAGAAHRLRDPAEAIRVVDRRMSTTITVRGEGQMADLLREVIPSCGMPVTPSEQATLTVLADRGHPDASAGPSTGEPLGAHLPVRAYGSVGSVGPLIVPGRTPCLHCHDLHRRDRDLDWPLIGVQWAQCAERHAPVDSLLAHQLAVASAQVIRDWIDSPEAVTQWSGFALAFGPSSGDATIEQRPAHPLCGCQWDALARTS